MKINHEVRRVRYVRTPPQELKRLRLHYGVRRGEDVFAAADCLKKEICGNWIGDWYAALAKSLAGYHGDVVFVQESFAI